ncbi:MAG: hypothetical protein ACREEY_00375 [Brevundimonas sp.]
MTKASNRTRPLDRDGDGTDGGSLPGNQTAPMASAEGDPNRPDDGPPNAEQTPPKQPTDAATVILTLDAGDDNSAVVVTSIPGGEPNRFKVEPQYETIDDLADVRTTPGDSPEKLDAIEREVDEANDAEWIAAAEGIKRLVQLRMAAEVAETGEEMARLQAEADQLAQELGLDETDLRLAHQPDTFTAEEIAAGQTPVIEAEGEATTIAAETAVTIAADDPLVQIETETAPIAVRERELRLLVENRRLYKSAEGYSSNYGAPYVDDATVQGWIAAGLAEDVPSAGNIGGVKPTHEARRQLGLIRHGEAA